MKHNLTTMRALALSTSAFCLMASTASAQVLHASSGSIQGSLCVGLDCASSESFGFDTFRLKENNLRINFDDTSASASFPSNDWRITANDSGNGGASYLSIDDATAGTTPFRVEAGAGGNALFVTDSGGNVGMGTATPVVELQVTDGDSPTIRLEQNGANGWTPQTWDLAGNETNFFVRDVTNGSLLPFKIRPGAPSNSLYVADDGDIGLGTASPGTALHVRRTDGTAQLRVEDTNAGAQGMLELLNNGTTFMTLEDTSAGGERWNIQSNSGDFRFTNATTPGVELSMDPAGNLTILGTLTTAGSCSFGCDRVFDEEYAMLTLEEHSTQMWEKGYLPNVGPTPENGPFNVSDKLGRVLNELEHAHIYISELHGEISQLNSRLDRLETTVE